jgi:hypothetical protein
MRDEGGSDVDASVLRGFGDFGISVFHRARRRQRAPASSLNRLPDENIHPVEQFVEPSMSTTNFARTSDGVRQIRPS